MMNKAAHWKTTSPLIQMTSRHSDRSAPRLHLAPFLLLAPCLRVRVHLQPRPSYEIPCRHRRSSISPIRDAFPRLLLCRFASPCIRRGSRACTGNGRRRSMSPEYAKRKKESLESEFRQMVGTFGAKNLFTYYRFGPFLALYRVAIISFQVAKLTVWHFFLRDIHKRASKFWETLIRLGPFYIKVPPMLGAFYCTVDLLQLFLDEKNSSESKESKGNLIGKTIASLMMKRKRGIRRHNNKTGAQAVCSKFAGT